MMTDSSASTPMFQSALSGDFLVKELASLSLSMSTRLGIKKGSEGLIMAFTASTGGGGDRAAGQTNDGFPLLL